jgi:hypothetical protein
MSLFSSLDPLVSEIKKFSATHQKILTLQQETNQLLAAILIQLGGKPIDKLTPANDFNSGTGSNLYTQLI